MGKAYFQLLEDARLNEQAERMTAQRNARLAVVAAGAKKEKKKAASPAATAWVADVRDAIVNLGKYRFTILEVYDYEDDFEKKHPENTEIRAHVRHTLQVLRDLGEVVFVSRGEYLYVPFEGR